MSGPDAEYLRQLAQNPVERQARYLALREAGTIFLTGQADSTESWACSTISRNLQQSTVYGSQPVLLDAGCGEGYYLAKLLADRALKTRLAIGLDREAARLLAAAGRLADRSEAALLQSDLLRLPFAPASFGAVMCNRMLNQTGDIAGALAQVALVLRPGGRIYIVTADSHGVSWLRSAHETTLQALKFPDRLYRHTTLPNQRLDYANGPAWLAPHFEQIILHRYERRLSFADPADLLEYYATGLMFQKSAGLAEPGVTLDQWLDLYDGLRQSINRQFAEAGRLTLSEGAGLFGATRSEMN